MIIESIFQKYHLSMGYTQVDWVSGLDRKKNNFQQKNLKLERLMSLLKLSLLTKKGIINLKVLNKRKQIKNTTGH